MAAPPAREGARLALGTAQFGLDYGISNPAGRVDEATARQILAVAQAAGIDRADTAAAYGDSESVLARLVEGGSSLRVITKAPKVVGGDVGAALERARRSAELFGPQRLEAILLHSASDLEAYGDGLWSGLEALKAQGLVRKIGFSAYASDDPLALADRFAPDIVQVAASVFDQRLISSGQIKGLADKGVEVHVRSIFLQGLIFMAPDTLPPALQRATRALKAWRDHLALHQMSALTSAVDFARSIDGADRLVVGVTSAGELEAIVEAATGRLTGFDYSRFALDDPFILDPWRW